VTATTKAAFLRGILEALSEMHQAESTLLKMRRHAARAVIPGAHEVMSTQITRLIDVQEGLVALYQTIDGVPV
jgi:mannose/cellobiose epimerase-like protein (N-acyl-D-glucosamine 2-epimerase family)